MRRQAAVLFFWGLFLASPLRAVSVSLREKFTGGTGAYRGNSLSLSAGSYKGFGATASHSLYLTEASPRAIPAYSLGTYYTQPRYNLSFDFSFSPEIDNYRYNTIGGSFYFNFPHFVRSGRGLKRTKKEILRTTLGLALARTTHTQRLPKFDRNTKEFLLDTLVEAPLRENVFTGSLSETFFEKATLSLSASFHRYDRDINRVSERFEFLGLRNVSISRVQGVVQGFINQSYTGGLTFAPISRLSLSGEYTRTNFVVGQEKSDSYLAGLTISPMRWLEVLAEYNLYRQSGESPANYFSLGLGLSF